MKILESFIFKQTAFKNRIAMAPMNRRRCSQGVPPSSAAIYYGQRADAGMLITDNIAVSPDGIGYMNSPGLYNEKQKAAWKAIVEDVHQKGGRITAQLVHNGRIGHISIQDNQPLVAPSAIAADDTIKTPGGTYEKMSAPRELKTSEIPVYVQNFITAAENAIEIGFDAVEIHAAHGFLIDQFLNSSINLRQDSYGGTVENRIRFLSEIIHGVVSRIGAEKTAV